MQLPQVRTRFAVAAAAVWLALVAAGATLSGTDTFAARFGTSLVGTLATVALAIAGVARLQDYLRRREWEKRTRALRRVLGESTAGDLGFLAAVAYNILWSSLPSDEQRSVPPIEPAFRLPIEHQQRNTWWDALRLINDISSRGSRAWMGALVAQTHAVSRAVGITDLLSDGPERRDADAPDLPVLVNVVRTAAPELGDRAARVQQLISEIPRYLPFDRAIEVAALAWRLNDEANRLPRLAALITFDPPSAARADTVLEGRVRTEIEATDSMEAVTKIFDHASSVVKGCWELLDALDDAFWPSTGADDGLRPV